MQRFLGAITGKPSGVYVVNGKEVSVTKSIGEGGNAEIFLVKATKGKGEKYALKRMSVNKADKEKHVIAQWEFQLNQSLPRHPNLVECEGASSNQLPNGDTEYLLLLEYCSEGTLLEWVQSKEPRTLNDLLVVFAQVLAAVSVFHACQPPIAHRDLKPENVLRSKKGDWKLCDFGSASTDTYVCKTAADRAAVSAILEKNTTPSYRAPEMCDLYRSQMISHQADIWALGVMFYQLLFREQPFPDGSLGVLSGKYHIPENHKWPKEAMDLLSRMLTADPTKRATILDVQVSVGEMLKKQPRIADPWSLPFTSSSLAAAAGRSKSPASPMPEHLTVNGHTQLKESSKSRSRGSDQEPPSPNAEGEGKKKKKSTKPKKRIAKDFADDDFEASFPAGETPNASPEAPAGFISAAGIQWQAESDPPSTNGVVVNEPSGDEGEAVAEPSGNEAPRRASFSHSHNDAVHETAAGTPPTAASAPTSAAPTPKRPFAALAPPPAIASTTRTRDGRKAVASPVLSPPPTSSTPTPIVGDDAEEKPKKKKKDKSEREGKDGKEKKKKKKQSTETSQVSGSGFGAPTDFGSSAEFGSEQGDTIASPGFDEAAGFDGSSEAWGDEDDTEKAAPAKKSGLFAAKLRGALSSVAGHREDSKHEKSKTRSKSKLDANDSQNEDEESFALRDSAASPSPEPVAPAPAARLPPPIPPRVRPSPIATATPATAATPVPAPAASALAIPKPPKSPKLSRSERKEQQAETAGSGLSTPTSRTLVPPVVPPSPKSPTKSPKSPRSPASKSKTTSSLPPPVRRTDSFGAVIDTDDPFGDKDMVPEPVQSRPISVSLPSAPGTPAAANLIPPRSADARLAGTLPVSSPATAPIPPRAQSVAEPVHSVADEWTLTGSEPGGWDEHQQRPPAIDTTSISHHTVRVEPAVPTLDPRENDFLQFRYANAASEREEFLLQPPRVWLLSDNTLPLTELDDCVGKATKKDNGVPRSKYARQLVLSSWAHQNDAQSQPAADGSDVVSAQGWVGLPTFITALQARPVTKHPQVAYKALLLIHRLMQQGSPAVLSQLFVSRQFLLTLQTAWTNNTTPSCVTDLVLPYAKYILRRVYFVYQHRQFEGNFSLGFYLSRLQSHAGWPNEWTLPLTPTRDQTLALMQCMHEGLALASLVFEQSQHAVSEEEVQLRQAILTLLSDDLYGMWLAATFTLNQLCLYTGATCATDLDNEFEQTRTSFTHTAAQVANTLSAASTQSTTSPNAPTTPAQHDAPSDPSAEEDAIAYSLPAIIAHHRTITDRLNSFFATVSPLPSVSAHRRRPNLPGRVNPFQPTLPAHFPPPSNIPRIGIENPQLVWKYQTQCRSIGSTKRRVITVDEDLVRYQTMIVSQQHKLTIPQPDASPPEPVESDDDEDDMTNPFAPTPTNAGYPQQSRPHVQQTQQHAVPSQQPKRKSSNPFGDSDNDDDAPGLTIQTPATHPAAAQQPMDPMDFFAGLSPTRSHETPQQQQQHAYQQQQINSSMNNLSIATSHTSAPSIFSPSPQPSSAHITPVTPSAVHAPFSDEIDPEDLQINDSLFKNETEEVWSGVYQGHTDVAIKSFKDFVYESNESAFRTELEIVRKLRHPHLVLFMGATTEKRPFSVVTELMETNLFELLHSSVTQLSWAAWLQIALDIAKAMAFLHATKPTPLVHRSLQSSCVLLGHNHRAKLSDFGFATAQRAASSYLLTRQYGWQWRAPEQLKGEEPITEKADVYAFGVILYEIVTRSIPYVELAHEPKSIIQAIVGRQYRLPLSNACPADFAALVQACWMPTPVLRPSFSQCIEAISTMIKAAKGQS